MTAWQRAALVQYVLGRLSALKGRYARELEDAFSPDAVPRYFGSSRARARMIGYLMGLEAWHLTLFGELRGLPTGRWLVSCAAATYDDAVDMEGFRAWADLDRSLDRPGPGSPAFGPGPAAAALAPSLTQLRHRSGVPWNDLVGHVRAINVATRTSFESATRPDPAPAALRQATCDKGGRSFQLLTAVAGTGLPPDTLDLAYRFGAACQIADDIYDVDEDNRLGQRTLATCGLIGPEDRRLVELAATSMPRHADPLPSLLFEAWAAHLRAALRAYDAGCRRAGWRHDLGQTVFRLGMRLIPGRL